MEQSDSNERKRADDPKFLKIRDQVNVGIVRNRKVEDEINIVDDYINDIISNVNNNDKRLNENEEY